MFDNQQALDAVERALDADPYCHVCGAPTTISDEDGRLWLVCSTTTEPNGLLARIGAVVRPHDRRIVVDLQEALAA